MVEPHKLQFNPKDLLTLFLNEEYDKLSENFISILEHFETITYFNLTSNTQYFINVFVENFLYFFTQPEYIISDRYTIRFIQLNPTISNLVAISSFKTTDAYLEILKNQSYNFIKFLALCSARNSFKVDRKLLFDTNSDFACIWYSYYYEAYKFALVNKEAYQNLKEHLIYTDDRLHIFYNISELFFGSTYIDSNRNKGIRQKINQSIQTSHFCLTANLKNTPNPKKIAIITHVWLPQDLAYSPIANFVESLTKEYELTLVYLGNISTNLDSTLFKDIKYISYKDGFLDLETIRENDFMVVYYPEIGLSAESIVLSNLRLAPIQICGLGQPVSTCGSEIDYFISGRDVEIIESAEERYSERLVLLPGLGISHNQPSYQLKNSKKTRSEFIINCSWVAYKANYPMLSILKEILKEAKKKVFFRFFPEGRESLTQKNGFIPFVTDIENVLGKENFEVITTQVYEDYMALIEAGDICLESYPVGGSNIVADCLYLRKPIVTLEGNKCSNRLSSQMLRIVGLPELITNNPKDYIHITLKLIQDEQFRKKVQHKLQQADLNKTIFNAENKKYFKQAIDYLITNHNQLKLENSSQPIIIH